MELSITGGEYLRGSFHNVKLSDIIFLIGLDTKVLIERENNVCATIKTIGPLPLKELLEEINRTTINILDMQIRVINIINGNMRIVVYDDNDFSVV